MSAPDLVVPVDVAVVDPDLLWRVEVMNALDGLMVKDVVTVLGAMEHLTPGHPAVVVLGPGAVASSSDQLVDLREAFTGVRVLGVEGLEDEFSDEPDGTLRHPATAPVAGRGNDQRERALRIVPDLPDVPDVPDPTEAPPEPEGPDVVAVPEVPLAPGGTGTIDRTLPAGSTLAEVVAAVHEQLAAVRAPVTDEPGAGAYRTLADTRVIVVTSAKGGDGATTVAANLASIMAGQGRAVGLVEGDPVFGDLALVLALPTAPGTTAVDPETGIRLVVPARPAETFEPIEVDRLLDQITNAEPPFEVVIVEAPVSIVHRSGLGRMADHLLVVCSAHLSSIKNAVILIGALGADDNLGVVVNRVGRKGLPRHELEETLQAHVVAQLPVDSDLAPDRPDEAPTLAVPRSDFVKELARLVDALCPAIHRP